NSGTPHASPSSVSLRCQSKRAGNRSTFSQRFTRRRKPLNQRFALASRNRSFAAMPLSRLLVSMRGGKQTPLFERRPHQLKPERHCVAREPARHGKSANTGEVHRDRENIAQVHGQWIIGFFANLECRRWRRRAGDDIALLKGLLKVALDKR